MNPLEVWKPIPGHWPYFASNEGRIRRADSDSILKPRQVTQSRRYQAVLLHGSEVYIHRAVIEAFVGTIPKGYQINHLDKDPSNNELSNLEITTPKGNSVHARWPVWYKTQYKLFE